MLKLPAIFSDNAIFQRRKNIAVWGWTEPETFLECEFASHKLYTASSMLSGKFSFTIPPMEADHIPHTLIIRNLSTKEEVKVEKILMGEVWVASGQSNMEFRLQTSGLQLEEFQKENRSEEEIHTLRMFNVKKNSLGILQDDCEGAWEISDNESVKNWSAAALWFGRKLQKDLSIPIGILHSSWGGTIVEAWTSKEAFLATEREKFLYLATLPPSQEKDAWNDTERLLKTHVNAETDQSYFFNKFCVKDGGITEKAATWMNNDFDDSSWQDLRVPGDWIGQKAGVHGAFWFRKSVTIPENWAGEDLYLRMPTIDKQDSSYFNGRKVGASGENFEYMGENRKYLIPGDLVKKGNVVIAIRAYSFIYGAGIYGAKEECVLENVKTGEKIALAGIWKGAQETIVPVPDSMLMNLGNDKPRVVCNPNSFCNLFNGMLHPLIPYSIAGFLWYQGESNASSSIPPGETENFAMLYKKQLSNMITDWRYRWGDASLPFIMVGLAAYGEEPDYVEDAPWAFLRESQRKCAEELENVYVASAVDCGDRNDIHPRDKKTVGNRLAFQALYHFYQKNEIVPCGPMPVKKHQQGNILRIDFDFAEGLKSKEAKAVSGFRIAGPDGIFHPCEGKIEGKSVLLSCKEVTAPCRVRYGWSKYPICSLVNKAELPAFPFEM